jgi:hypothetical protein
MSAEKCEKSGKSDRLHSKYSCIFVRMTTCLKTLIFACLAVALSLPGASQDRAVEALLENVHNWREGRVMLSNGNELSGLVRFDDNSGILTFQDGDISKTLIARSVAGFEFYDEGTKKQRVFISIEYDDGLTTSKFYFFEMLKETETFAILSKVDPIDVQMKSTGSAPYLGPSGQHMPGTTFRSTEIHQTETVFIMDANGGIKPYVRIFEREVSDLFGDRKRSRNKFVDKKLLETYTGNYFAQLEDYAEKNDLSFKIKGDLLKVIDYYTELIKDQ